MTSIENLYDALVQVSNPTDPQAMRASEETLQTLLKEIGVLRKLQTIAITRSLDLNARRLAIIQAKNATASWRMKMKNPEEDLVVIRSQIIQMLEEPDDVIATNNEIMAAKIARLDFPIKKWDDLLTGLVGLVRGVVEHRFSAPAPNDVELLKARRALSMLNGILKEFGTMKSPQGTQMNIRATEQLHEPLRDLYFQMSQHCQSALNPAAASDVLAWNDLEVCRLTWKCYSRIMLWAWNKTKRPTPEEEQAFIVYFSGTATQLQTLVEARVAIVHAFRGASVPPGPVAVQSLEVLTRHIKAFGRAFRRMQQVGIVRFVALPEATSLVLYYWNKVVEAGNAPPDLIADSSHAVYPVRFLVQGMAIFKDSLAQWSPSRKSASMETDNTNEVLSAEFVDSAINLLVNRFIPLNASDLSKWQEDPEEWANAEEKDNDAWEYDVRPCSERVLMTLSNQYPKYAVQSLTSLFQAVISTPPGDLDAILRREAVYCAVGRCAHRLKGEIGLEQWLPILEAEARETNPSYRIMKRRIAWLLGRWHAEQCAPATNPKVWEILLHLLTDTSPGTDTVVRFSASTALGQCVNTVEFSKDVFRPYIGGFIQALLQIVNDADTIEIKTRMTNVLNTVIECTQQDIVPYIPSIVQPLPSLWTEAGTDYMLKQSLLVSVKVVIEAAKEQSVALHPLVVPLVQESFAVGARVQLDDDGALLWIAALRDAPSLQPSQPGQPGLLDLLPLAVTLLNTDLDLLGSVTKVIESYFILDAKAILRLCPNELFQAYASAIRTAIPVNVKEIIMSLALLIQLSDSSLTWASAIHTSGMFSYLLKHILDGKGSALLITEELHIFARMVLQDPVVFIQLVDETAAAQKIPHEQMMNDLLDQWWRQFDCMAESRHRKLTAMALGNLATTGRAEVVRRLPTEISSVWLDVMGEMKEALTDDPDNPSHLHLYWSEGGGEPPNELMRDAEGTLEEERRRTIWKEDPVQTVKLTTYLGERLKMTEAVIGPPAFQSEFITKTDPGVLKQLTDAFAS